MTALTANRPAVESGADIQTTQILIVDDHPVVRHGLRLALNGFSDLQICAEADGEDTAIQLFHELSPDFVIVDMSLNEGSGLELIKQLIAIDRQIRILVWSMHDESLFAERVLRAGAMGFLNKCERIDRVVLAIRRILSGKVFLSERMADLIVCRRIGTAADDRAPIDTLSDRELEVFQEIGRGVTTRQIAAKLGLSPKTIETYRENIKCKLHLSNSTELTKHAVQWVLENA